jgi:hypothetical protein
MSIDRVDLSQWKTGANIGIIRIPDAELDRLRQIVTIVDREAESTSAPLYTIASEDIYQQAIDRLVRYLQPYTVNELSPIKSLGINAALPGLITTTAISVATILTCRSS